MVGYIDATCWIQIEHTFFTVLDKNKNRFFVTTTCKLGGCGRDYMRVGCDMYSIVVSSVLHIADKKRLTAIPKGGEQKMDLPIRLRGNKSITK